MDLEFDDLYCISRINGTIYVTTRLYVSPERQEELELGAGELYLTCIPHSYTVDQLMQVAHQLGDVYRLRFKIGYSGESRGFAYLQYVVDRLSMAKFLQIRFRLAQCSINVCKSRNIKKLLISRVENLTPIQVYQELRQICRYVKLSVHEVSPLKYLYIIVFRNNDDAAHAHHTLRAKMVQFGPRACVKWVVQESKNMSNVVFSCCVELQRGGIVALEELRERDSCCYRI